MSIYIKSMHKLKRSTWLISKTYGLKERGKEHELWILVLTEYR